MPLTRNLPTTQFPTLTRTLLALTAALIALAAAACSPSEPDDVVFMVGYKPQANLPNVAAYVAQEKGFFTEQGLAVDIRHATSGEHMQLLMAGDVDYTTADAADLLKRRADPGLPLVAFALFGQRGQQGFVALQDSGISNPKDWEGKTFGYKFTQPPDYLAILEAEQVNRDLVNEVRVGFDPRVLTEGQVDILAIFKSNEPDTLRRLGFEVTLWDPADYGVPSLGLTYLTSEEIAAAQPDRTERFLKATMRGLDYAMNNPGEAVDIVLKYAPDEDREHQRYMLETELLDAVSALTDERGLGWMTEEQWRALYDHLADTGALPKQFDYTAAFSDRFLQAVYEDGELAWP